MRFARILILASPFLVAAEEQQPLLDRVKSWFDKAQSYIPTSIPIQSATAAAAAKAAAHQVHNLTLENWRSVLSASGSSKESKPEEWMVMVTGGRLTCSGRCANVTKAWNESVPVLSLDPNPPHLALLDCEQQQVLCNSWMARPATLWHILLPQPLPDQSKPSTTVRIIPLNRTDITSADIAQLHTKDLYKDYTVYEGIFHPFDGWLQNSGFSVPVGYVLYAFGKVPSWVIMIAMSFFSRTMMNRRMAPPLQRPPRAGTAGSAGSGGT